MSENKKVVQKEASWFSRYGILVLTILGFILLIVALSQITYVYTKKITEETRKTALVGEMAEILQEIARISFSQESYLTNEVLSRLKQGEEVNAIPVDAFPANTLFRRTEIRRLAEQYTKISNVLEHGGSVVDAKGDTITVGRVQQHGANSNDLVFKVSKPVWDYYYPLLKQFELEKDTGYLTRDYAQYVMSYTREYNRVLQRDALRIRELIQANVLRLQRELTQIQAGILLASFVLLMLVVFLGFGRLNRMDKQVAEARNETTQILNTINEGLFLVDKDLNVGHQYSAQLENIIGQQGIGGKKLNEVMTKLVDQETMEVTETFIEQLYSDWVVEDLIDDLNPLRRVEVKVDDGKGYERTRHLDFKFFRAYNGDQLDKVLCSVNDITDAIVMEEKLEAERALNDSQVALLGSLLAVEPDLLDNFIRTSGQRIENINDALRRPEQDRAALQEKARLIFREAHSMKGEASALKLSAFVSKCEALESKIKELQDNPRLTGNDFLGLTMMLDEVMSVHGIIGKLNDRITQRAPVSAGATTVAAPSNTMQKYFASFAQDIASRNGKKVQLTCEGMDDNMLSGSLKDRVKEIAVQMLRNAVVHGIETPAHRQQGGKSETGHVQVKLMRQPNNTAELLIEDDGSGLHFDKIRQKLVENGTATQEEANQMTTRELMMHLFDSGLSTAEKGNEDAGRGVGMDIVRERIAEIHGKLKIASQEGQFTRFSINFPLV